MRLLDRKIILDEGEIFSVDTLINQTKAKKRERRVQRRATAPAMNVAPLPHGFFSDTPPGTNVQIRNRGGLAI